MPKGPNGEWRPRDPIACSAHVMKVLTGEIEETFEPPADERRPPDPAAGGRAGGRARAAKMTGEERTASAKRAAAARWGAAVLAACLLVAPAAALAQTGSADVIEYQLKMAKMAEAPTHPLLQGLVWPTEQTAAREYFGYRTIVGGITDPTAFPDETWIRVACLSQDPRVKWDSAKFGTSSLVAVHAVVYELNADGSLDFDAPITTWETDEPDEAICDLGNGVDASFIEVPRTFKVGAISLFSGGSSRQYVEVVENVERMLVR